ncbi:MAG: hypothetical protein JJ931_04290 [Henriciella sp.]|nr:hypothetical protein [Henriciella sp.]MBO6694620.1 hypothetical protein [Henriciella sp.]
MPGIDWSAFSWEAFATLVAGSSAVIGAVFVASRQQKILKHQSEIERLKLRSDTFELRWSVYQTTIDWLRHWYQHENVPAIDLHNEFMMAMERSKFLFRPAVYKKLREWDSKRQKIKVLVDRVERMTLPDADVAHIQDQIARISDDLNQAFKEVSDLFGKEMKMSEHHFPLEPLMKPPKPGEAES